MSALAILAIYLATTAAIALALQGAWLTFRSYVGEGRVLARRLKRAGPGVDAAEEEAGASALARLIDRRIPGLRQRLAAAGAPINPTHVVLGSAGMFVLFLVAMSLAGVPLFVALLLALWGAFAGPFVLLHVLAARRRAKFLAQMPQAVDMIARSLQAGHPVTTAMAVASRQMPDPCGPEFGIVIAEMNFGLDRDAALRNLLERFPLPELRMFVASMEVTRETGGNLSEVFLKLGETIRAKAQLRKKVNAISAEGKLTFWVVSGLPVVVGGAIMALNPNYYGDVISDALFWPLMSIPPVLLVAGAAMIWRMINFRI